MSLQLFIVILIGIVVSGIVIRAVYRFFFVKKKSGFCGGCKGCDLQ
ncbi:MAG TPA: FeoB-associated Cys-rich membrane protein [Petrimonas sp.]|nr:FeoB-associated Cys-rich membrane protein [Petrimonas sp.]MEA4980314.1 FeoB-associated Cys-rich membrane protein [Petrimonas sp.]MEA5062403.1 FeoB-associated Cys-rich membrane protein [Petrimonas sp.]HHV85430.1 FeoB-associated Cys-rich membrane protein [Petrimonas sp.]